MSDRNHDDTLHDSPLQVTRRALEEHTTPALKRLAREYARGRVSLIRRTGRPAPKTYACELVDDVYADTWAGALPWDPSRCTLLEHLRQAIKHRTWLEIRHGKRVSLVPLHEPANDESEPAVSEQVECALAEASRCRCDLGMLHAMLAELCQEVRPQVSHDDEATFVVQCWEKGSVERDVVMALTGLSEAAYERARKRLFYASRNLSAELREVARDVLRNAS